MTSAAPVRVPRGERQATLSIGLFRRGQESSCEGPWGAENKWRQCLESIPDALAGEAVLVTIIALTKLFPVLKIFAT